MTHFENSSSEATKRLAGKLAKQILLLPKENRAKIIALSGDLGAGKTTFTQGFMKALGVRERVASPTFILLRRHKLPKNVAPYKHAYHIDAYRVGSEAFVALGIKDIFKDPSAIVLIEWAERLKKILPRGTRRIRFRHGKKPNERIIAIRI